MFNQQLLQELLKKYGNAKAIMPMIPGAGATHAIAGGIIDKVAPAIAGEIGADANAPAPGVNHGLPPLTPPAMPPVAENRPAISALPPVSNTPAPIAQPPAMPQQAVQTPQLSGEYNDAARQELYDRLAKQQQMGGIAAAAAAFGDAISKNNGGNATNNLATVQGQVASNDKTQREQFESGRKGEIETIGTNLSLKKAGREETEYQDDNNPNSPKSKLAVELAMKYGKGKGVIPGQTSYADVIKVLPIMEKDIALETAKANKELAMIEKTGQFNDRQTQKFRNDIQSSPAYKNYQTVHGMAKSIKMAAQDPSAYGDLSAIYGLVKGLDPSSVVREGEIGLMRDVSGLRDQLLGKLQKWNGQGPLTGNQMADVEKIMNRLEDIAADNVRSQAEPSLTQARRMKLNENEILGDIPTNSRPSAAQNAPKPLSGGWKVVR